MREDENLSQDTATNKGLLAQKVIIVAGGGGLLGRQFGQAIARQGGLPVLADVDLQAAQRAASEIEAAEKGRAVEAWKVDVTSKDDWSALIKSLHQRRGRIDALVNAAYPRTPNYGRDFFEVAFDDFCQMVSSNIGGVFLACQQLAEYFLTQGRGNIVNVASIYGVIPPRFEIYQGTDMTNPVEYAAIKAAVIHLTKYLAKYFKGKNIRVNAISPGGVLNRQDPIFVAHYNRFGLNKGLLNKDDINGTLIYLLSDLSEPVNGQNLIVDDGFGL